MKRFLLTIAIGLGLGIVVGFAQPYAVTTNIQTTSYSKYLDDYMQPNRVFVTLLSTDARPSYQAFLQVEISGEGYTLKSNPSFIPPPITLYKDQPMTLTGAALASYLHPNNLDFNGMSLDGFLSSGGQLPDGPISICVEVYDYNRVGYPPISNTSCSLGNIQSNQPPIITAPKGFVRAAAPQNFLLSWQPQHFGAFPVEYTVEIYLDNTGFSPDVTVNSTTPIFVGKTNLTTYNYSAIDPLLQQDEEYLIQVKATDILGLNYFENNGWSQIESFHFGGECPIPVEVRFGEISDNSLEVLWQLENYDGVEAIEVSIEDAEGEIVVEDQLSPGASQFIGEGLEPGTGYSVTICSVCEGGITNCVELGPIATKSENECEAYVLESFSLQEAFAFYAELGWSSVPGASQYEIRYREAEGGEWNIIQVAGNASQATIAALIPGTTYEAQIRVMCFEGEPGEWSDSVIWNADCAAPEIAWVENFDHQSALFSWFNSPYAKNYRLQYRRKGTNSWSNAYTTDNSKAIEGLQSNTTYEYRLKLKCLDNSWSSYSPIFEFTTLKDCNSINASAIHITNITASSATITIPASNLVEYYMVKYKAVSVNSYEVVQSESSTIELEFLDPNTTYEVIVAYDCENNWSDWTSPINFTTLCGASDIAWAESITANSATLLTNSIKGADEYQFDYRQKGDNEWIPMSASPDLFVEISGLSDLTTYEIRVRSKCGGSWSNPSDIFEFTTGEDCSPPANITIDQETIAGFKASWPNNSNVNRWQVFIKDNTGGPINLILPAGASELPGVDAEGWTYIHALEPLFIFDGLESNTSYTVKVKAWCSEVDPGDISSTTTGTTLTDCQPPGNVYLDNFNDNGIDVNWDPDPLANTWELSYRPHIKEGTNDIPWTTRLTEGAPTIRLTGLAADQDYEFRLRSNCGNFGWTGFGPLTIFNNSPCGAPTNVTEEATSSTTMKLSWTGSGFSTFTVLYRPEGVVGAQFSTVNTNYTFVELTGLQTGQVYEYTIAANCFGPNTSFTYDGTFELERESLDNEFYECGIDTGLVDLSGYIPLPDLFEEDSILVSDFKIYIKDARGWGGSFSGTGYIPMPYLNMARINFDFQDITINSDYQMIDGEIIVTGIGVRVLDDNAAAILDDILTVLNTVDDVLEFAEDIIVSIEEVVQQMGAYLPASIITDLENAKQALEAAVASGNQSDIIAAEAQLQTASDNFKTEMTYFVQESIAIMQLALQKLETEYQTLSSTLTANYNSSEGDLDNYLDTNFDLDIGNPANGQPDTDEIPTDFDEVQSIPLSQLPSSTTSQDFYQKSLQYVEKGALYRKWNLLKELNNKLQSEEELELLIEFMGMEEIDLLQIISDDLYGGQNNSTISDNVKDALINQMGIILFKAYGY